MPRLRPRSKDKWTAESEQLARQFIRSLHPTVPPNTRDVRRLARWLRMFARERMVEVFNELSTKIQAIELNDPEE